LVKYKNYFESVSSQFYFDDMSSKNVIINGGKFNGLVDLDGIVYGDYLEGVGRIKASWYGTKNGDFYVNAIMSSLGLSDKQKEIVCLWALLNRIFWQSEMGMKFNQNTSQQIDSEKVEAGNIAIDGLAKELGV